ncbi:T9SS type A sorting domain-containing protein [Thermaurantimonas aggregans]|uniref:T9SS type A sorting domain-containing protein n=1 Tax=Thermaurantimonas aggregans TaxID=2173829 RepID=UPI0023F2BFC5|nr:T9SS type A sorting domain-containing protein [Thermaurantimonas aggregans]MCX8149294.1 T9SS type A sorting domain-containing protein [Thermaurantimonas aggregans]
MKKSLCLFFTLIFNVIVKAQIATYSFSINPSGTYVPITGGTVLGNATTDDQRFVDPANLLGGTTETGPGFPIGFNFMYNGVVYDRIGIRADGVIRFGISADGAQAVNMQGTGYTSISNTSSAPTNKRGTVAGFNMNLQANGSAASIRLQTLGTAPNRICVIQWTNYRRSGSANTADTINFQIRLHETTNQLSIVFGTFSTPNTSTSVTAQVGLRGFHSFDFRNVTTTSTYANAVPGTVNTASMPFVSTNLPTPGLTYTWSPATCFGPLSITFSNVTSNAVTANWQAVTPSIGYQLQYGPAPLTLGTGTIVTTATNSFNLTGLTPGQQIAFFVRNICSSGDTSGWLGPFSVTPNCNAPSAPTLVTADTNQITIGWVANTNATFEIEYGPVGFTQGTGTLLTGLTGTQHIITGLLPGTTYQVYLRIRCNATTVSPWSGALQATTTCSPLSLPFAQTFATWPPTCFTFSTTGTTTQNWAHYTTGGVTLARANFWNWSPGITAIMNLPRIFLSQPAWVRYTWSHQFMTGYSDSLFLEVKADTAVNWIRLQTLAGPSFNTQNSGTQTPGQFQLEQVLIPTSLVGQIVYIRLVAKSGFGPDVFIDFVEVEQVPSCVSPTSLTVTNVTINSVTATFVKNNPSSVTQWQIGPVGFAPGMGFQQQSGSVTGTTITITGLTSNTAYHLYIRDSCGVNSVSSWFGPVAFTTLCDTVPLPIFEDFIGWPPTCFTFSTTGQPTQNWAHYNVSGASMARANFWTWVQGTMARMQLPRFNYTQPAWIKYAWSHQHNPSYMGDSLFVEVKAATSNSWIRIQSLGGPTFNTPGSTSITPGQFQNEQVIIPTSLLGNQVDVRFVARSGFGPDVFIDFIEIENIPGCLPPSNISVTNIAATSATVNFTKNNPSSTTRWEVGVVGFTPGTGNFIFTGTVTTNVIFLTGLTQNTQYHLYLRDSCGTSQQSNWIGPFAFTTQCLPYTVPFSETFTTWPPLCFTFSTTGSQGQNWSHFTTGGTTLARANFWNWITGVKAIMRTPFVQINQLARLRFYWSHQYMNSFPGDSLYVLSRNDSTGIADTILVLGGPSFNTPGAGSTSPASNFIEQIVNLSPSYVGKRQSFEFHARSGFGPDLFIDQIVVENLPQCPAPQNFVKTTNTATTATFSWTQSGSNTSSWDIEWGPTGFTPGSNVGTLVNVTSNPATITGLPSATCLDFYIRAKCSSVNDSSAFVGPVTVCMPIQFDVEISDVISPVMQACGNSATQVRAVVRNNGFDPISNVPVVANITGDITQTFTASYTGTLQTGQSDTLLLGTINTVNGANLNVQVYTNLTNDQVKSNDTVAFTSVYVPLAPKADSAFVCAGVDTVTLKAKNYQGVSYRWYNSPTSNTPVGSGPTFFVSSVSAQNTYYLGYGTGSFAQTFTYSAGDIPSDYGFQSLPGSSSCPGVMTVHLPLGVHIDSISVEYSFTAASGAWMIEQRSQLRCLTTGLSENQLYSGVGQLGGTMNYARSGLTIANGVVNGPIVFQLHAGRTWGGSGCNVTYNFIPNNTWKITVYYTSNPCSNVRTPVTVGVKPLPTASFTYSATNYVVNFISTVTNADSVYWTFGTAGSSSQLNPTFTFPGNGVYPVCLKAFNSCGSTTSCDTLKFSIGLEESIINTLMQIYPNPNDGVFEVSFSDDRDELPIRISDLMGKTVFETVLESSNGYFKHNFDLKLLPKGVYLLQVSSSKGWLSRRLVIQ